MQELISFYKKIPNSKELKPGELIPYFAYYVESENGIILAKDISKCFELLTLPAYSGVGTYLIRNADKKVAKFIKQKNGYKLNRNFKEEIESSLNLAIELPLSANFFDTSILNNTQYYLKHTAEEMCKCYDAGLYDASLVLMRKLLETLIVEVFERFGIENEIKDVNGNYKFLSDLIPAFIISKKWNASRNIKSSMDKIKKYGDLSAHNRRFIAGKNELDDVKFDIRQAVQEIVFIIDYTNWVTDKKLK